MEKMTPKDQKWMKLKDKQELIGLKKTIVMFTNLFLKGNTMTNTNNSNTLFNMLESKIYTFKWPMKTINFI